MSINRAPLITIMSTITETDIMIDGMSETAFPYLNTLVHDYKMSVKDFRPFGIQLMEQDYSITKPIATMLYDAWEERRKKQHGV